MRKNLIILLALVAAMFFVVGCSEQTVNVGTTTSTQTQLLGPDVQVIQEDVTVNFAFDTAKDIANHLRSAPDGKEYTITTKGSQFSPEYVHVKKGDHVHLHVQNHHRKHSYIMDKFGVDVLVPARQAVDMEFIADKVGHHNVGCHSHCKSSHHGVRGTLVVVEE